jgi:hypothetical protein
MIYAGSSPSVSLLEYLCIKGNAVSSKRWYMIVFDVRDESLIGTLDAKSLPPDWNVLPHGNATQDFGKTWLEEKEFPFLKVPSARLDISFYPVEHNVLINSDFPSLHLYLRVKEIKSFTYLLDHG